MLDGKPCPCVTFGLGEADVSFPGTFGGAIALGGVPKR